jgi:c-di-GMP-binding flagellar brake protein YcgR
MRCRCEGEGFRFNGYIVDISYGGAGIVETKKFPTQGTELLVTIRLPWKMIELRSRVVWVKSDTKEPGLADFGVEFLDTLEQRQEKLAEFFPKSNAVED